MIPNPFAYHRPSSVGEAVALLAAHGEEARPLAGGHSLIPMMKLRMAAPEHLVDLAGIAGLREIAEDSAEIVLGAMATQTALARSALLAELQIRPDDSPLRLNGSGMLLLNAPWQFDLALAPVLPALVQALGEAGASHRLEWLREAS